MRSVFIVGSLVLILSLSAGCGSESPTEGGTIQSRGNPHGSDDRRVVPEGLSNTLTPGNEAIGMTLLAFTLTPGTRGSALYASVRNDRTTPVCEGGMRTDYFDKSGQMMSSSVSVLSSGRLYALGDGTIISCVAPGEIAMAASTNLPEEIVIDELGYLQHTFPAFVVDGLTPIEGLSVSHVETITQGTESAYRGIFTNGLAAKVSAPKVTVFPVNRVGRPLGVATSLESPELPPAGTWNFETSPVSDPGEQFVAIPTASIERE